MIPKELSDQAINKTHMELQSLFLWRAATPLAKRKAWGGPETAVGRGREPGHQVSARRVGCVCLHFHFCCSTVSNNPLDDPHSEMCPNFNALGEHTYLCF